MISELISRLPVISFLTTALETILDFIDSENIGIALQLFGSLLSIAVCILGLMIVLDRASVSDLFYRTLIICFYVYFIQNYELITSGLLDFFSTAGVVAGGGILESDFLYDPSDFIARGILLGIDFAVPDDWVELFRVVDDLYRFVCGLFTFFCFLFLAVTDFIIVVEYHVLTTLLLVLFPFGLIPSMSFISENVISALFKLNCKIMVFSFVVSLTLDLLENELIDLLSDNPNFAECLVVTTVTLTLCYLVWKIPNLAASMISGSPMLNAQGVTRATISTAIRTVKTAASTGAAMLA